MYAHQAGAHTSCDQGKCQVQSNPSAALFSLLILALASASPVSGQAEASVLSVPEAPAPEFYVPFGCGRKFQVSQAHATGSHLMNDTWAWDFRMPSGVPIVAAADGTVRLARGDSTKGGCDPSFAGEANYVVISHANELETQYLHLESVVVTAGDKVKEGDLLGYSGKTGWACGSHLHFKVARSDGSGWNNPSIPSRIKEYGDPVAEAWVAAPRCDLVRLAALEPKKSVDPSKTSAAVALGRGQSTSVISASAAVGSPPTLSFPDTTMIVGAPPKMGKSDPPAKPRPSQPVATGTGATE